jgi:hypothetical protein
MIIIVTVVLNDESNIIKCMSCSSRSSLLLNCNYSQSKKYKKLKRSKLACFVSVISEWSTTKPGFIWPIYWQCQNVIENSSYWCCSWFGEFFPLTSRQVFSVHLKSTNKTSIPESNCFALKSPSIENYTTMQHDYWDLKKIRSV